jgi:hypothetical protein
MAKRAYTPVRERVNIMGLCGRVKSDPVKIKGLRI